MENFPWVKNYPEGVPAEIKLYEYPSLVELFETSCKKFQDRVAFENMGVKMTYREVDKLSKDFAAYLQSLGLVKGDRIAIQMPNLLQFPVAFLVPCVRDSL
jgi:long-chain acyl-CoA synthetase